MQTGSLINQLLGENRSPAPEVGMGATVLMWSDRHAATVIAVTASGKTISVREDRAIRLDSNGMSDAQDYRFEPNPDGRVDTYTLRRNGAWVRKGDSVSGQRLALGHRSEYRDFTF